jgi:CDP-glucose 4,6-dehydratase
MDFSFEGRKVLVTGHTGFKGSWLTLWLNMLKADVTGIALDPGDKAGAFNAMNISSLCKDIRQDINDYNKVFSIFREQKPEIVFHLAAQPLVLESYQHPVETFKTNVMGTVNILEACRETASVKAIIIVTTDKCYENKEWVYGYREDDRLGGKDPYSASKAAAELVVKSFRESFFPPGKGIGLATVRAGNVIGGGDWASNRIVPDCIRALQANNPIEVRNPFSVRPWQHVLEPLGAYLMLAHEMIDNPVKFSGPWNFGPDHEGVKNVKELVKEIIHFWEEGNWVDTGTGTKNRPHEAGLLTLDISKARNLLLWQPSYTFCQAVEATVSWYKSQFMGENMAKKGIEQIEEYRKHSLEDARGNEVI